MFVRFVESYLIFMLYTFSPNLIETNIDLTSNPLIMNGRRNTNFNHLFIPFISVKPQRLMVLKMENSTLIYKVYLLVYYLLSYLRCQVSRTVNMKEKGECYYSNEWGVILVQSKANLLRMPINLCLTISPIDQWKFLDQHVPV